MQGAEQGYGVANNLNLIAVAFPGTAEAPGTWHSVPAGGSVEHSARCWPESSGQQHQVLAAAAGSGQGQLAAVQRGANVLM